MTLRLIYTADSPERTVTPSETIDGLYSKESEPPKQAPVDFVGSDFDRGMLTRLNDPEDNEVDYFLLKAVWWVTLFGFLVWGAHFIWWWAV